MGFFSRSKSKAPQPQTYLPPPVPADTRPPPRSSPPPERRPVPPPQYSPPQTSGIIGSDGLEMPYTSDFQPAGYPPLPANGWTASAPALPPAYQQQSPQQQAPIVVNQHYYLYPGQQGGQRPSNASNINCPLTRMAVNSAVNLTNQVMPGVLPALFEAGSTCGSQVDFESMNQLYNRFNEVMTLIDRERYCGNERDLFLCRQDDTESLPPTEVTTTRGQLTSKSKKSKPRKENGHPKGQTTAVAASVISGNYFAKVELYANSRLPMNLPPLKLYIPTWPLLCLAAQYSEKVYDKARGKERDVQVEAGNGGKAMVIKSVPMDHMNTIVFAIRGTSTFMDWSVNLNTEPVSPSGFLDDDGNFCHTGFLSVARRMVKPVAARLRQLLQENPSRRSHSLLITGHSAGGAVAALLYSHMLSTSPGVQSELNSLTDKFKRVHCITFGTPPISLLPLQKPATPELKKSLFLSFVNEGDPVARADKAYVRSLLDLFATPAPTMTTSRPSGSTAPKCPLSTALVQQSASTKGKSSSSKSLVSVKLSKGTTKSKTDVSSSATTAAKQQKTTAAGPVWKLPPCALSNAGRIVVLRSGDPRARLKGRKTVEERLNEGVVAQIATDEQLRTVVWGDPVCHLMKLYAGRMEILAVNAVTAKGY